MPAFIFRPIKKLLGLDKEYKPPPLPPPEPPVAIPETGEAEVTKRRKGIKAGRGGTILAGSLSPQNIGRKQILG